MFFFITCYKGARLYLHATANQALKTPASEANRKTSNADVGSLCHASPIPALWVLAALHCFSSQPLCSARHPRAAFALCLLPAIENDAKIRSHAPVGSALPSAPGRTDGEGLLGAPTAGCGIAAAGGPGAARLFRSRGARGKKLSAFRRAETCRPAGRSRGRRGGRGAAGAPGPRRAAGNGRGARGRVGIPSGNDVPARGHWLRRAEFSIYGHGARAARKGQAARAARPCPVCREPRRSPPHPSAPPRARGAGPPPASSVPGRRRV